MSSRTLFTVLVTGSVLMGVGACTSLPVRVDANPALSVGSCHSYAFAHEHVANAEAPSAFGNPLNAERLRLAIQGNLQARGITLAPDAKAADCVVGYAMGTRQVFDDFYGGYGVGFGGGWGGWGGRGGWGGFGYDQPFVRDETRIAVDVFDARSRTPIWHATVSQTLSDLRGPRAEEKINAAASAIFAKFPGGMVPAVQTPTSGRST